MSEWNADKQNKTERITLAVTGASGVQYGFRLLQCLVASGAQVLFLISRAAREVAAIEADIHLPEGDEELESFLCDYARAQSGQVKVFGERQWTSPVASGSGAPGKMVVCPCSAGSLSAIATGASNNLIERAADVALKERLQLILVPREAPYSEIHLEHMLKLTRMGAVVIPASPGFYNKPESIADMVDFVVARILRQLGIEQALMPGWGHQLL